MQQFRKHLETEQQFESLERMKVTEIKFNENANQGHFISTKNNWKNIITFSRSDDKILLSTSESYFRINTHIYFVGDAIKWLTILGDKIEYISMS